MNDDFEINLNALHEEWVKQPRLYREWAEKSATARYEVDKCRDELKIIESELALKVRNDPNHYGLEKATEDAIKQTVAVHKDRKAVARRFNDLHHELEVIEVAVSSLDHKKKALENLVQLRLASYFSDPQTPKGESGNGVKEMQRREAFGKKGSKR